MKRSLLFCLLLGCFQVCLAQTNLWSEDFSSGAETTSGTAAGAPGGTWSVTTTPSGTFQRASPLGIDGFYANNTGTEGVWATNTFSIAATGMATISIEFSTAGTGSSDYARAYYIVDSGSPVLFAELTGSLLNAETTASAIVSGSTLQIEVRMNENSGFISTMRFTNVAITSVPAVFSRANSAWNVGTTWSATGFTGSSCGCTPTTGQVAIVGGGFTVDLTADANVGGLNVKSTGTLRYTAANVDLGIEMGLVRVESGGTINRNGQSGAQIDFNQDIGGANMQVDAGGTVTIQDITLSNNASSLHYFSGGGSLTLSNSILIGVDGASLTNNMSSSPTITNRVEFQAGVTDAFFINNQTLTVPTIYFDDDNCTFTNNATLTVTTIQAAAAGDDGNTFSNSSGATTYLGAINAGDSDFNITNSGTILQTGNITNVVANADFQNLNGSSWTWSLSPNATLDAQLGSALDCSANSNTFTYSGAGAQDIVPTTYHHLILANSGTKSIGAALDVNGDLTIQSGVTLSPGANAADIDGNVSILGTGVFGGTGNVNVGGNWSAVDAASYVEGTRTTTFDGAAQTINNASGTETFGNVAFNGSGTKSTTNAFDVNGNLSIGGTAQLSVSNDITLTGNWTVTSTNPNPFVEGTFTVNLDGAGQTISTVLAAGETFNNLIISGSGTKANNSILNITGDLLITGSAQLDANSNITLGGDWDVTSSNADAFVQGTAAEMVTFNGSSDQTITHSGGEAFNRVTVNKPGGNLILASPISIANSTSATDLTLTQGKIISTSTNLITIADEATTNGGDADSYVDGPVRKLGEDSFIFPIGNGAYWARVRVTPGGANNSTDFTAQYFAAAAPNGSSLSGVARVSGVEYWEVNRTAGGTLNDNTTITLYWENGTRSGINDITPASNLFVARYNGANWVTAGTGSVSGSTSAGSVVSSAITSANISTGTRYYTFGTNATLPENPLPIELLYFNAKLDGDRVHLSWSTASELNNDFFTIERASNIEQFEPVGLPIDGAGTTKERRDYSMIDEHPLYGRSYYRLKQTDFDGKFSYSDVRVIDYEGPKFASLKAYPNPSDGARITVLVIGLKEQSAVPIQIYNVQGQMVYEKVMDVNTPGTLNHEIEFSNPLNPGVYFIKAGPTLQLTQKIFIH